MPALVCTVIIVALTLIACSEHDESSSTPAVSLPTLERTIISVKADSNGVISLPSDIVIERGGAPFVFVFRDGRARYQMVRTGKKTGQKVQIVSGLTGAELLVVGQLSEVHDGSPVHIKAE